MKHKLEAIIAVLILSIIAMLVATACSEADRVSYNLSQEADNFNIVRQLTVINCIKGDTIFQMTGKLSIKVDTVEHQLEVTVEDDGKYVKHFIGLSENTSYLVEDLNLGANEVSKYRYKINFNPNMWLPAEIGTVD